ncbi:general secretion pathway protein D [Sphingomonas zeicaulis]|uniref:type II secretion system secretin GspD n=1 Tax=Sphingomonas zeicaulis TaxID=1632740 RepID=UPI003D21EA91
MKKHLLTIGLALALAAPLPLHAQQTLNVRDADIRAFIQDAARVTGRTFIIDQRVQGKVSVVTDRPLSRSEYFEIFLSTIRANGLIAVPTASGAFRIQPADGAASQPGAVGGAARAPRNAFVTEIFRLKSIDATSAVETIRPLVSREGSVTANRSGNSVVVADFADNIRRIRQVIAEIDRDSATTRLVPLKNAGAREIAQSLQQLVGTGGGEGAAARGPAATIVAIDSSNSIALRGDGPTVARLADIAADLDRRAATGTEIRVLWLQHADAEKMLPVLQQLVGQQPTYSSSSSSGLSRRSSTSGSSGSSSDAPAPTPSPSPAAAAAPAAASAGGNGGIAGRGPAIITRFEGANALVIAAPPEIQRTLGEVVRQLDTRREQVLVEAVIAEISDATAKRLGVQLLFGGKNAPFAVTNYSNSSPSILSIAGAIGARELSQTTTVINGDTVTTSTNSAVTDLLEQNAAQQILAAQGGFAGFATKIGSDLILGAIVNAVKSDNQSNLLSAPSVMTLDNQEARILVGQEIPITTGQALSNNFDNAFRTVQRQNVGISLEVKPVINAGGTVKLELRQEVSSIAGPVSEDFSDLILNKREIETTITIDDGEIVGIGGLLDDNERRTVEKIPFLGDLPGLGVLFRSKARSRAKTNLMVFIRPTILRTAADSREVSERRYGYMRQQQLDARPDREPTIDELVREYMGATPPIPASQLAPGDAVAPPVPGAATEALPPAPAEPAIIRPEVRGSTSTIRPVDPATGLEQK